jgi:hypothetical protein
MENERSSSFFGSNIRVRGDVDAAGKTEVKLYSLAYHHARKNR